MTRTVHRMYDSTSIGDIPRTAQMLAVYADGLYSGTVDAARKRFPKATLVTITVRGEPDRHVADCEQGDLTPSSAARWAAGEVKAGRHPTIYCSASPWPTVKAAVRAAGLNPDRDVSWWIAQYDGNPTIPAGAVAKQYLGSPGNSPGHYDVSSVADYWPGVDPKTSPAKHHIPAHVGAALFLFRRWLRKAERKGWTLAPHAVERLNGCDGEIKALVKK